MWRELWTKLERPLVLTGMAGGGRGGQSKRHGGTLGYRGRLQGPEWSLGEGGGARTGHALLRGRFRFQRKANKLLRISQLHRWIARILTALLQGAQPEKRRWRQRVLVLEPPLHRRIPLGGQRWGVAPLLLLHGSIRRQLWALCRGCSLWES